MAVADKIDIDPNFSDGQLRSCTSVLQREYVYLLNSYMYLKTF